MVIKGKGKKTGAAATRLNSNVFAMFDQKQIAELKEAFSFIDSNNDGLIDKEDLGDIWQSLGLEVTDELLEDMLGTTGPLNFTLYLTLMGERVQAASLNHESELIDAFQQFDQDGTGLLSFTQLRQILTTGMECLTDDDFDVLTRDVRVDQRGMVDYKEFVKSISQTTQ